MRWDISLKRWTSEHDFHWQPLCTCFDHEALGIVERALRETMDIRVQKVEPVSFPRPGD